MILMLMLVKLAAMFTTHDLNGKATTYENGDDWVMVQMALLYPH